MKTRITCAALAIGSLAVATTPASAAEIVLRFASVATEASAWAPSQEVFKRELEERTDGRIEVQIFNNNTLGSNREALELARAGNVDFVLSGLAHASRFAPQLNAVLFPYMWKDRETMFEVLDGEVGQQLSDTLKPQNMSIIGWWDNGFRHVSSNVAPINELADFQGLRLRTLPSSVHVAFFTALGAAPTPMDFAELMPALQQGVLDGQENPPGVVYPYRIFEVQEYYSLTAHVNEPMIVVMSESVREKLSDEDLAALEEAIAIATDYERKLNDEQTEELLAALREEMTVNEVPSETIEELRQIAYSIYEDAIADLGEGGREIVEQISAANQ